MKRGLYLVFASIAACAVLACSSNDSSSGAAGSAGEAQAEGGAAGDQGTGGNSEAGSSGAAGQGQGGAAGSTGGAAGSTGGSAGGSGTAGSAGGSGTGGSTGCGNCGSLEECYDGKVCVAKSIAVTGGYSIDATEVTQGQYEAWTSTKPSTGGQGSACAWNTSFTPTAYCWGNSSICKAPDCPQVCVDWCDAVAYCKAAGKRLCGKIGGGTNPPGDFANAAASQWFDVCTSGGANAFPYGNTYDGAACNAYDLHKYTMKPVASMPQCQTTTSGYSGVYDLSGNVAEWEDSCDASSKCRVRGGYFNDTEQKIRCADDGMADNFTDTGYGIGFRCCSL